MDEIRGYVEHIVYRNEQNAYTVFEIVTEDGQVTCTGYPAQIAEGESCLVAGQYSEHPVYGQQFQMKSYTVCVPEGTQAVFRYLSSGAVKGIGEALARRIIRAFGEDTMRIIDEEPERLAEIKGISEARARDIAAQIEGRRDLRDAMIFLAGYGIGGRQALRIWQTYGMELYGVFRDDPYRLAEDIEGIGFITADEIARRAGIRADSEFRIRCALEYVLGEELSEGSSCMASGVLTGRTAELLSLPEEAVREQLSDLAIERRVCLQRRPGRDADVYVYSALAWQTERDIARMLLELAACPPEGAPPAHAAGKDPVGERLRRVMQDADIEPDPLQEEAVRLAAGESVLIISGGPGTGKTTTINTLIRFFTDMHLTIALAAPTGRAAKRMTAVTGSEAMTIHRLLGVRAGGEDGQKSFSRFEKDESDPLEADVIIIDEMSMVDMFLFRALLRAVRPGARLIMTGDVDQLPSVGPGQVLRDLVDSGVFRTVVLSRIFRQAAASDIVMNAHRIREGMPLALDNRSRDFFFLERTDPQVIYKHLVELMRDRLPGYLHCTPDDIQVLTPMKKGSLGAARLNEVLQSVLNPPAPSKGELRRGDVVLREGDKVMQVRNNYQIEWEVPGNLGIAIERGAGVFNGDTGRIEGIDRTAQTLDVCFDDGRVVRYPLGDTDDLDLAYAITVHKSQGTEYAAVLLPVLSGPAALFNRNLLYTAVTRARGCVVILGRRESVGEMIRNTDQNTRATGLADKLREAAGA